MERLKSRIKPVVLPGIKGGNKISCFVMFVHVYHILYESKTEM